MHNSYITISLKQPYDLRTTLHGHGWIDLPPHRWDEDRQQLDSAVEVGGQGIDLRVRQQGPELRIRARSKQKLARSGTARLRSGLRRMLRTDVDLQDFWRLCRKHEGLAWVARRRAGHLMQSTELFEDLLKLLFTTNCSWAATKKMCERLVASLGLDYRARHCLELATLFAQGDLSDEYFLQDVGNGSSCRKRLLALSGFGPYAVGQALRGLEQYEDLALDSWCRAKLAEQAGRRKPPSDASIEKRYAKYGAFKGLAMWMDLTADWHTGG
ncbi:MAG: DNA glycosylase family protein [Planctomycetota bacterium]